MRNRTLRNSLFAIGGILLAAIVIWQLTKSYTSAEPLSENDAIDLVENIYSGKKTEVSREGDVYKITFEIDSGIYEIDVHRKTGDIANLKQITQKPQEKTDAEIREILEKEQTGEIKTIEKKIEQDEAYYYATVIDGDTEIIYKLNAATGEIIDVVHNKMPPKNPPQTPETPAGTVQRITEQQAIEIALTRVKGAIEEVELEEEAGQYYYFVEIETAEEEEITVQVHAISGEVISIVMDD